LQIQASFYIFISAPGNDPMKLLIVSLLISALYTSCCVFPDRGLAHTRIDYYKRVRERNAPIIYLEKEYYVVSLYYNHKRKQIWYECSISNESKDTLKFNIRDYYMSSNNMEFYLKPISYVVKQFSDRAKYRSTRSLQLAPGATIHTVLAFNSNNKITRQQYNDHLYSDSLYLVYSDKTIKDTILCAIGVKREY
jgi:hypothetical protein